MLAVATPNILGYHQTASMDQSSENAWRQSWHGQMPVSDNQWSAANNAQMGGMHDTDLRMFQNEDYEGSYRATANTLLSPQLNYTADADWASDYDAQSPANAVFAVSSSEMFPMLPATHLHSNLRVPIARSIGATSAHSPTSSFGSTSPQQPFARPLELVRPVIGRSHTAPTNQIPRYTATTSNPASEKQHVSEEDDDNSAPEGDGKQKNRKRQRIPHTAVERRYREALNAGIKSLQVAVLSSKQATGNSTTLADDKPSKSTILHGAIEQIQTLSTENVTLKNEMQVLQARISDLEKWCVSSQTGAYGKY